MSFLDTIAGVVFGAFLLAVAVKGNSTAMIDLAKRDKAFLQWAIAIGILLYLYNVPALRGNIGLIIAAAFIGLGITAGDTIFNEGRKAWNSLGA